MDIRDLTLDELKVKMKALGEPSYRAGQIFAWLYRKRASSFDGFTDLSKSFREELGTHFSIGALEIAERAKAKDGTVKILFRLGDGRFVEAVAIPSGRRLTLCLSTQVGCRFGCVFCASGLDGFKRNLTPSEIVGQILSAEEALGAGMTNYVFMGMGEPLDNFENVERALRIMNAPEGLGVAARRMTVSTAGFLPGLTRFAGLDLQVNLSVSLHAATDNLRNRLMPINRKYPLERLVDACEDYRKAGGRKITCEYIVIGGLNDTLHDADGLTGVARRLEAKVNLIAYSYVSGLEFETPDAASIARFGRWLKERGIPVTLRQSKGVDIGAACGQLAGRLTSSR